MALSQKRKAQIGREVHQWWEHQKQEGRYPSGGQPGQGAQNPYPVRPNVAQQALRRRMRRG